MIFRSGRPRNLGMTLTEELETPHLIDQQHRILVLVETNVVGLIPLERLQRILVLAMNPTRCRIG